MASVDEYQVKLSAFQGPLDLLLFLIRRAEVDIHDIPIAAITNQYLEVLKGTTEMDVEQAGEFLVLAATLVEIKSRLLSPKPEQDDSQVLPDSTLHEDPRRELVQQLLAYQRFRTAAETLDSLRSEFSRRWSASGAAGEPQKDEEATTVEEVQDLDIGDVHLLDLLEAFERITLAVDFTRLGEHQVAFDDTPIGLHQDDLVDRLSRAPERRMNLESIFEGRSRMDRIGLFLALLELAREQRIKVRQTNPSEPIELELTDSVPAVL
ncbi:MAG: segregation/condensation protein A [Planctomycetes bacterium]|nr:segregation/condensation protein A [Planctomycetota bacterium]